MDNCKFGPQKGHFLYIFENFFKNFGLLVIAVIMAVILGPETLLNNIGIVAIAVISPIFKLLSYFTTSYAVDDEKLIVRSGIFNKKQLELPLQTITTVDLLQSLPNQIFHAYRLKINNESGMQDAGNDARISFVLKEQDAFYVKELLIAHTESAVGDAAGCAAGAGAVGAGFDVGVAVSSPDSGAIGGMNALDGTNAFHGSLNSAQEKNVRGVYTASNMDFVIKGLLQAKGLYFWTIFSVYWGGALLLFQIFMGASEADATNIIVDKLMAFGNVAMAVIAAIIIIYISTVIYSVIGSVVKYYNFKLTDMTDSIKIEYGLLNKRSFTIAREKISGVMYRQPILMRAFHTGSLEVFASGYGDESKASVVPWLFPLISQHDMPDFMERLLPEIPVSGDYCKAERKSLRYFFIAARLFLALLLLVAGLICWGVWSFWWAVLPGILAIAVALASIVLEYRNSAMFVGEKSVGFACGGLTKKCAFVRVEKLEQISAKASIIRERKGIATIGAGYLAPALVSEIKVRNLPIEMFLQLKSRLE